MTALTPTSSPEFPPRQPTPSFPYLILAKVGEGAMGEVYRAEETSLGRLVAVKVIKPSFLATLSGTAAHETVQRFAQEARAAAALSHPGVTTVYRVGSEGGWPYIAMEWLEGRTLEAILAEHKRLTVQQAAGVGLQVLAALAAAHAGGVVHRDIKPANLMASNEGRIKVTDFGVARVQGASLAYTQPGAIVGTPVYAAPEQLAGQAVDARADLYALGSVIYEAVVGRVPFEGDSVYEVLPAVLSTQAAPPSSLVAAIPPGFDEVLLKALAKSPEARFANAAEMAAALRPFAVSAPTTAAPPREAPQPAAVKRRPAAFTQVSVPSAVVDGTTARSMVIGYIRNLPANPLGRQPTESLLQRLFERPLHAPAFCGALEMPGACLLVSDGIIHAAFDPASGRLGDDVIDGLPADVGATLHAIPAGVDPRLMSLFAAALLPPMPRLNGLDASYVDLPQMAEKLATEGFDGALRITRGPLLGLVFFSRGRRVLDLFSAGWPAAAAMPRWEDWVGGSGATASVEPARAAFPSVTYRQQLKGIELDVVRTTMEPASALRSDALADARALQLRPSEESGALLHRGESTLQGLLDGAPSVDAARWLLTELALQFDQYQRTSRWKGLVEPLQRVEHVRLHHHLTMVGGGTLAFDVSTVDVEGRVVHVLDRVSVGSRAAVEDFVRRAVAVREQTTVGRDLAGAVLMSSKFSDDALAGYMDALKGTEKRAFLSSFDALSHREGFLRTGVRGGFHLLLVEEGEGRRRPLMPA